MAFSTKRQVVIDDADPSIVYWGGNWTAELGSMDDFGTNGPPYLRTLHGTPMDGSFTTSFTGTQVDVRGTYQIHHGSLNPDDPPEAANWTCLVDGTAINPTFQPPPAPGNNLQLCHADDLPDGSHNLTVHAHIPPTAHFVTFWLDSISYTPSAGKSLDNTIVRMDNTDSAIQFSSGWSSVTANDTLVVTSTSGATANISFFGESVSWYGNFTSPFFGPDCSGAYSIDGGTPAPFSFNVELGHVLYPYSLLFTTPDVENGPHKLFVTYTGNTSDTSAPLYLDFLLVKIGSSTSTATPGSPDPASTPTSPADTSNLPSPKHSSNHVGGIVGGVVGGIAALLAIIAIIFFWRRKRHRDEGAEAALTYEPFVPAVVAAQRLPVSPVVTATNASLSGKEKGGIQVQQSHNPSYMASPSTVTSSSSTAPVVNIRHQDSGLRFTNDELSILPSEDVDRPPDYSKK